MKMNEELENAFNKQITLEFESSMLYRQLAIEFDLKDLPGIAGWMKNHAAEELTHADRLIEHLTDRDNHPVIGDIRMPAIKINTVAEAFEVALEAEEKVSESIRNLYRLGVETGDVDSRPTIDWFIAEQIEEEATVRGVLGRAKLINEDGPGLLRLDDELSGNA
ncbi:MAG: ferritin [Gordonia sp. (in: high G+C Gram-positive bacteria)]|uniref:ferritin n=1 Tax=Gordonia sp. (in: high G+C Gram-positive bacteria) TaxID=84139 RepID=UPI0039E56C6E